MLRCPAPDPTNRERQARHRGRRKAILAALSAPGRRPVPTRAPPPDRLEPQDVKSAIRKLSRMDRLASAEAARVAFIAEVAPAAGEIGRKLVEMGLQGDVGALIAAARALAPPARDDRKIRVELPPLTDLANIARARVAIGAAVAEGRLGLNDATDLMRLVDSVEQSILQGEKRLLLQELRQAVGEARQGGAAARAVALAAQAESLLALMAARSGDDARLIDAQAHQLEPAE